MDEQSYLYVAINPSGNRVRGMVTTRDEGAAFEQLRREGLSPVSLRAAKTSGPRRRRLMGDRETVELLGSLGNLLQAGADMRTALDILGSGSARPAVATVCRGLVAEISGGGALDQAFARHLTRHGAFIGAMVAAGEASGDLPGALSRTSEMIDARAKLRHKLVSILSYPAFVLLSTVAAVGALLLFVVPALAPLVTAAGTSAPLTLAILLWASDHLRANLWPLLILGLSAALGLAAAAPTGVLGRVMDQILLRGPVARTASGLVFGGFALALGGMLTAGASMSEALRLATRSVGSGVARARLEPVIQSVRQGQSLSVALEAVPAFPPTIARLATVGEATGSLGAMLSRGGKLEEEAATRRIEAVGQLLGPALIVVLGGLVGLLMAGLLSGVSQLGEAALQ